VLAEYLDSRSPLKLFRPAVAALPDPRQPFRRQLKALRAAHGDFLEMVAYAPPAELRALDVLLVARRQSKPLAYDAAVQHCSTLDVQGIQGWRLPDVGELASLGEAGMLGRAMYWSQTAGDTFGDTHMAWNGRSNHAATRDRGAVALCVRGDHGQTP